MFIETCFWSMGPKVTHEESSSWGPPKSGSTIIMIGQIGDISKNSELAAKHRHMSHVCVLPYRFVVRCTLSMATRFCSMDLGSLCVGKQGYEKPWPVAYGFSWNLLGCHEGTGVGMCCGI